MGTLNVNTIRGRVCEVVETLSCRKVDVCCIQETRYHGGKCRIIKGKDTKYKLYWSGNDKCTRDFPRPNLGPVIGPYYFPLETEFPKFYTNFPMSHFLIHVGEKFYENRTKNKQVTADYMQVCSRL